MDEGIFLGTKTIVEPIWPDHPATEWSMVRMQ